MQFICSPTCALRSFLRNNIRKSLKKLVLHLFSLAFLTIIDIQFDQSIAFSDLVIVLKMPVCIKGG
jgi:hypothetical protein